MILKKKQLDDYQRNHKLNLPDFLITDLLNQFGNQIIDEHGHFFEYNEQDIYEQMRKIIQNYIEEDNISK